MAEQDRFGHLVIPRRLAEFRPERRGREAMALAMSEAEVAVFLAREFPHLRGDVRLEGLTGEGLVLRQRVAPQHLRQGGTVSGPAIFALADIAFYLALLSRIGPDLPAATTSAAIDFLHRPEGDRDLLAEVRLLKLGRSRAVGDVLVRSDGAAQVVARASLTCSVPAAGR
jgi:acyl-coenzyme A thioesterase PaaI-like protein